VLGDNLINFSNTWIHKEKRPPIAKWAFHKSYRKNRGLWFNPFQGDALDLIVKCESGLLFAQSSHRALFFMAFFN
jgi:hypothetical protein